MTPISQRLAGLTVFGLLVAGCSHAEAAGDTIARELREASAALSNWSEMKTEDFDQATHRTLRAMDQRITQLRDKVANSKAADKARETLAELETKREQLGKQMQELGEATSDKLSDAKQAMVDGITDLNKRLGAAWDAFAKN